MKFGMINIFFPKISTIDISIHVLSFERFSALIQKRWDSRGSVGLKFRSITFTSQEGTPEQNALYGRICLRTREVSQKRLKAQLLRALIFNIFRFQSKSQSFAEEIDRFNHDLVKNGVQQ